MENLSADDSSYVISPDVLNKMSDVVESLVKDKEKLRNMSKNCIKVIKDGKFSIKKMNEKLEKIYREFLKNERKIT